MQKKKKKIKKFERNDFWWYLKNFILDPLQASFGPETSKQDFCQKVI